MTNKQENYVRALREMRQVMIEDDNWENLTRFIEAVTAGGMAIQMLDEIREQPKTGYWINTGIEGEIDGQIVQSFSCSECGAISIFRIGYKKLINSDLCPNCVAKMIQESEE